MKKILAAAVVMIALSLNSCSSVNHRDIHDLRDTNPVTRHAAVERIATRGQSDIPLINHFEARGNARRAVGLMVELFTNCKACANLQLDILSALAALSTEVELPPVIFKEAIRHKDPEIRERVIEVMAAAGRRDAVPVLIEIVNHDSFETREKYAALWSLGEIGGQKAISFLEGLLDSEDKYIQYNAYGALAKIAEEPSSTSELGGANVISALGKSTLHRYHVAMTMIFKKIVGFKSVWAEI